MERDAWLQRAPVQFSDELKQIARMTPYSPHFVLAAFLGGLAIQSADDKQTALLLHGQEQNSRSVVYSAAKPIFRSRKVRLLSPKLGKSRRTLSGPWAEEIHATYTQTNQGDQHRPSLASRSQALRGSTSDYICDEFQAPFPSGGCLSLFADQWKKLTDDKGILEMVTGQSSLPIHL